MGSLDSVVFGKKKFSNILEEIYNNQKKKEFKSQDGKSIQSTKNSGRFESKNDINKAIRYSRRNFWKYSSSYFWLCTNEGSIG